MKQKSSLNHQEALKIEEQVKWGFLKNIVNIDSFFSSGFDKNEAKEEKSE